MNSYNVINSLYSNTYFSLIQTGSRPCTLYIVWYVVGGLLYNGYRIFSGGKMRPGRDVDPSPPSSAVVMKE